MLVLEIESNNNKLQKEIKMSLRILVIVCSIGLLTACGSTKVYKSETNINTTGSTTVNTLPGYKVFKPGHFSWGVYRPAYVGQAYPSVYYYY